MGTPSDSAGKEANRMEQERRAQVAATTGQINNAFNNPARQQQYADFLANTRKYYTDDLNRQNTDNNRQLKFSLARSGQTGGSVAVDAGKQAGQKYQRALIDADRVAQQSESDLRNADDRARLDLIAMASQGLDATTGASQATSMLRNNLAGAVPTMQAAGLDNVFGSFAQMFERSRADAERRRGEKYVYDLLYGSGLRG